MKIWCPHCDEERIYNYEREEREFQDEFIYEIYKCEKCGLVARIEFLFNELES